jgi:predicted DNA-binding transcriptional regulator YafY
MNASIVCDAIKSKLQVQIVYAGKNRTVEPHAVGYSREGNPLMRAWQVSGGSSGNESTGWKLFRLDEINVFQTTAEPSKAPRTGYKKGDPALSRILCEV